MIFLDDLFFSDLLTKRFLQHRSQSFRVKLKGPETIKMAFEYIWFLIFYTDIVILIRLEIFAKGFHHYRQSYFLPHKSILKSNSINRKSIFINHIFQE